MLVAEAGRSGGLPYREALDGSWQGKDLATSVSLYGVADAPPQDASRSPRLGLDSGRVVPVCVFSRARVRFAVFLGILVGLALVVALGDAGGISDSIALFPGLRVPGRILFLATAGLALLGALGLEAFVSSPRGANGFDGGASRDQQRCRVRCRVCGFGEARPPMPPAHGWPWIPLVLVGGLVAVVASGVSGWRRVALATALAAVVIDLTTLGLGAVGTIPVETEAEVRRWIGPPAGGRAISLCENRISAREFLQNREPTLDGLPGLHLRAYADWAFIAKKQDVPPGGLYHRIGGEGEQPARRDLLDMANVTRIIACAHGADGR